MREETKQFIYGLENRRPYGGMVWHGQIPEEIKELLDIKISSLSHGVYVAGVYVKVAPSYEPFKPDWQVTGGLQEQK